jgi:predicted ATP-dependent serine protease
VYPKDFQWMCANCNHASDEWTAICPECGEIGRKYWHLYANAKSNSNDEE